MTRNFLDDKNAAFWNELCGSGLAKSIGITDHTPESLRRFDEAYMAFYPYLNQYIATDPGKRLLEIGLGYGTLGQILASKGFQYYGLDIAAGPASMMRTRLEMLGINDPDRVRAGSALEIPFEEGSFDYVYSIGCLHHTGNLPRAIDEVHRVLAPSGRAVIMLYYRHSFRQRVQAPLRQWKARLKGAQSSQAERVRAMYDTNTKGEAAPHTDYVSKRDVKNLFKKFSSLEIELQNFDSLSLLNGRLYVPREKLLGSFARLAGLDLYIRAAK